MEILELKSTLSEIKTLLEGLTNVLKMVEEHEVEDQSIKIIQPGREKRTKEK